MSLKEKLKNNEFFMGSYDFVKEIYLGKFISDERLVKKTFKRDLNRNVNLKNPLKYNDKLQWLKLNWQDDLATTCADKYEVREIIKQTIGEKYLNPLLAVYDSVDEIKIEELPNRFVLKGTHGSGFNIICHDKNKMDWNKEFKKMRRWLRKNYYIQNREPVYKNIKPRIICEEFLVQDDYEELRDYRFFCFNGEPKFITVDFSITDKKKTRRNLYTLDWDMMDAKISYDHEKNIILEKPVFLEEMISLSKKLSSNFPHARIDFYYINNKIIFGEITFFHQSGKGKISPEKFELQMGEWLKLPEGKSGKK